LFIGLCFGVHWYTYFESIQRSSATLGILALSTYGIHVTWMGALFSTRRPQKLEWCAVLLAAGGAWIALPTPNADPKAFGGFLLGMVSGLFYAALPLLHKRVEHVGLPTRGAAQFFFAWLLFLPFAPTQSWTLPGKTWVLLTVLGVFCTFIAHNLWIKITTQVRPSTSGLLYYLALPVTMVLETLVLGRAPSLPQLLGATLIVGGNAVVLLLSRPDAPKTVRG
jgi:drug/metabolite transporter (DMT)-like permease